MVSVALEEAFYVSIDTMLPTGISTGCKEGDIEKVKAWLGNGGSINAEDPHGETLLHVVCSVAEIKHVEIVEVLIRRGADVNQKQGYTGGRTPLMAVAESGGSCGAQIALRLMAAGAHKEEKSTDDKETAVDLANKKITKLKKNQPEKLAKEEIEEAVGRYERVIDAINNRDAAPAIKEAEAEKEKEEKEPLTMIYGDMIKLVNQYDPAKGYLDTCNHNSDRTGFGVQTSSNPTRHPTPDGGSGTWQIKKK